MKRYQAAVGGRHSLFLALAGLALSAFGSTSGERLRATPGSSFTAQQHVDSGPPKPAAADSRGSCDCGNICRSAAGLVQKKRKPAAFAAVSTLRRADLVCPPGQPCNCGCHCTDGVAGPAAIPPPTPTYPPPWYMAPCPPWGCACNYGVCVPGVTHPGPPILDALPIGKPGLPGGTKASDVPSLPAVPTAKPKDCPTDPNVYRPWWCPEPPPLP